MIRGDLRWGWALLWCALERVPMLNNCRDCSTLVVHGFYISSTSRLYQMAVVLLRAEVDSSLASTGGSVHY